MGDGVLTRGTGRKTIHLWKKYNVNSSTTYWWNTYNVVSTTTYKWNKYNRVSTTTYTWNKWNVENSPITNSRAYVSDGVYYTTDDQYMSGGSIQGSNEISVHSSTGNIFLSGGGDVPISYGSYLGSHIYAISSPTSFPYKYTGMHGKVWCDIDLDSLYANNNNSVTVRFYGKKVISVEDGKGSTSYGTVSSTSSTAYPNGGVSEGYWYDGRTSSTSYSKGSTSYGTVTSTSSSAYPSNGYSGSYWYVSAGSSTSKSKGSTSYGYVTSSSRTAYPDNSYSGDRWYVYDNAPTTNYSMGSYIEDVLSTDPNKYPVNAKSGSYWYVYQGQL